MFRSRKRVKLISKLILLLFLTTSTCTFVHTASAQEPAAATQQEETAFTLDKSQSEESSASDSSTASTTYLTLTDKEKALNFVNSLTSYYLNHGKKGGPEWLKTTDIQLNWTDDNKPVYSLLTLQPFGGGITKQGQLWFWQGRYAHSSDTANTANIGIGWRKLSTDKTSMVGLNTFYDYGFQYNLARVGLGVEYFNKLAEYRANMYHPVTGERLIDASTLTYIRAVDGFDYEMGTSFTHMQWLKIYAGGYYWDNHYHDNEVGYKLRTTMQLTPRIQMEMGYSHSNLTHEPYLQITYNLASNGAVALWGGVKTDTAKAYDLTGKMLQKVQRQNDIKTETYSKSGGTLTITAKNSADTSYTLPGLIVTLTNASTGAVTTATTDSAGTATFSSLKAGTYSVSATDSLGTGVTASASTLTVTTGADTAQDVEFSACPLYVEVESGSTDSATATIGSITFQVDTTITGRQNTNICLALGSTVAVTVTHPTLGDLTQNYNVSTAKKYVLLSIYSGFPLLVMTIH